MRTDELDYVLPAARIAVEPASPRDAARLMVVRRESGAVEHRRVRDLPALGVLRAGDLMVVNDTRVVPGRFEGLRRGTGGRVTGLMLSHDGRRWGVLLKARGTLRPGEWIDLGHGASLELVAPEAGSRGGWSSVLHGELDTAAVLDAVGRPPLPPYILAERKRRGLAADHPDDAMRYATTFASASAAPGSDAPGSVAPGSAAAPTAGLHLTPGLLAALDAQGVGRAAVTLDIGRGTFEPVHTEALDDHPIHAERLHVPAATIAALHRTRAGGDSRGASGAGGGAGDGGAISGGGGGRVLAVGTTTVRALESLPHPLPADLPGGFTADTDLFITPGRVAAGAFTWRHTDHLLTNFHLPRSTLLAMVAALPGVGLPRLLGWYRTAIAEGYRFYSFGDAMLIV